MEDQKMGASTVAEVMEEDEHKAKRTLVQFASGALVLLGLISTGYLSFMLYSRAFPDNLKILAFAPTTLIEGSLAVFMLGSFVWFAHGVQGSLSKIFGWLMFAIVALNCIVEFNVLVGGESAAKDNVFLSIYSFWGVPLVIPLVIGFWKAVLDSDPSIQIMRQRRKIQQTLQVAKMHALMVALGKEESRIALSSYGDRNAEEINKRLRGGEIQDAKQLPAVADPHPERPAPLRRARLSRRFAKTQVVVIGKNGDSEDKAGLKGTRRS